MLFRINNNNLLFTVDLHQKKKYDNKMAMAANKSTREELLSLIDDIELIAK